MSMLPDLNRKKTSVAIIGGGVSGLAAAWHLHTNCAETEVYLFEKDESLGGHAHTVTITPPGEKSIDVDIGFMVYNDDNYPNMCRWFEKLGVQSESSDMSLSVSLDGGKTVEWSSQGLSGLIANKIQVFKPSFYRFLRDLFRFNKEAGDILTLSMNDPRRHVTIGQYLRDKGYSDAFATYYLFPMTAALWSSSIGNVVNFPAAQLIGFMCNHKMMQIFDRPAYKTVAGRSRQYTEKMQSILGGNLLLSCAVTSVVKVESDAPPKYELFRTSGKEKSSLGTFDNVVFACHSTTTHDLLRNEKQIDRELLDLLSEIQYNDNVVYLHSDTKMMPKRKSAWASWNCIGKSESLIKHQFGVNESSGAFEGGESGFGNTVETLGDKEKELEGENGRMKAVYVTYNLNMLQNLSTDTPILVSLNPHQKPDPKLVYKKKIMAHPQFTSQTLLAREEIAKSFQGKDGLWFCGAWQGYGFHEDGCRSGFEVAASISKISLPWCDDKTMVLAPPNLVKPRGGLVSVLLHFLTYRLPTAICKRFVLSFLQNAVKKGILNVRMADGSLVQIGDGKPCGCDSEPVTLQVFDDWFFVKIAMEYDLGLARSYMAGYFNIEQLDDPKSYHSMIRPLETRNEANSMLGDPVGLTRLFLLFVANRDTPANLLPMRSSRNHTYSNSFSNAAGLMLSKAGSFVNFLRYRLMDNSERGGSLKNIHAHYDLSNDLFLTFLDKKTLMYSSAIYDGIQAPTSTSDCKLQFRGTLEEAEMRKMNALLDRAQLQKGQTMLDIGFGWGGLSIHAAKKYGCKVTGITLSVQQKSLAEARVKKEGLEHLINFEVIDYRTFARKKENRQKFDRVLSCEMIEAVGHNHLGEFFWAVEQVLHPNGVLVMEAITTPESRYESYLRTTDFINTIIFPGGCAPSLHALVDASYRWSTLTLEHIDNIGLHYAETLREWRRRFNANEEAVRKLGFDDVFMRVWNYYMTYCEAGFESQTENCLILVFSRPGCKALLPLCATHSVTTQKMTEEEALAWFEK